MVQMPLKQSSQICLVRSQGALGNFSMLGLTKAAQKGHISSKLLDSTETCSGLLGPLFGMLQYLKVRLVQYDISGFEGSVCRIVKL